MLTLSIDGYVASPSFGGFISYIDSLTRALLRIGVRVVLCVPAHYQRDFIDQLEADGVAILRGTNSKAIITLEDEREWRRSWLPLLLDELSPSAHIGPAFFLPNWRGPMMVTVHDLLFESNPDQYPTPVRDHLTAGLSEALDRARKVLVVSKFTGSMLQKRGVDEHKVVVTPLAPPDLLIELATPLPPAGRDSSATRAPLTILNVGGAHMRKRLDTLVAAFDILASTWEGKPLRLKLVGVAGNARAERLRDSSPHRNQIELTPILDSKHLAAEYQEGVVFVYPSEYEGFGLPPLEAMAFGCPVISWRNSALEENLDGAALLLDDYSPGCLAAAMQRVLEQPRLRQELISAGAQRALQYSWSANAIATRSAALAAIACTAPSTLSSVRIDPQ